MVKVSYVIATYKGAHKINSLLDSILKLKGVKESEFIFVVDGKENSAYPVILDFKNLHKNLKIKIINFEVNKGISYARNVGIKEAKGEFVTFTDDDCVLPEDHLLLLLNHWKEADKDTVAFAGEVANYENATINQKFINFDRPLRVYFRKILKFGLLSKIINYYSPKSHSSGTVDSVLGANFSVRNKVFNEVGYFNERIKFGGDETFISSLINSHFGAGSIKYLPNWYVLHKFEREFKDSLRRSYSYAKSNGSRFIEGISPLNLSPTPALLIFFFLITTFVFNNPILGLPFVVIFMFLLNFPNNKTEFGWFYLVNPILKTISESADNIGFMIGLFDGILRRVKSFIPKLYRGYLINNSEFTFTESASNGDDNKNDNFLERLFFTFSIVVLSFINYYLSNSVISIFISLALPYLLGSLLIGQIKGFKPSVALHIFYSFALGMVFIMVLGFLISILSYRSTLEVYTDLNVISLYSLILISLALLPTRGYNGTFNFLSIPKYYNRNILLFIPIFLSLIGAFKLNVYNNNFYSYANIFSIIAIYLLIYIFPNGYLNNTLAVFTTSLSLLYSYSFRGFGLFGWDIQKESSVISNSLLNDGYVHNGNGDAYSSMLSLSTLPSSLIKFSHIEPTLLLRFFYPLVFSIAISGFYELLSKKSNSKVALTSLIISVITTVTFSSQIFAISRQEIGFFYFLALLLLFFDNYDIKVRRVFFLIYGCALAFSHYTTDYVTIFLLLVAFFFSFTFKLRSRDNLLTARILIVVVLFGGLWNFVITRPGTEVVSASNSISSTGIKILDNNESNFLKSWVLGTSSQSGNAREYRKDVKEDASKLPWLNPDSTLKDYEIYDSSSDHYANNLLTPIWSLSVIGVHQLIIFFEFILALLLFYYRNRFKNVSQELLGLTIGSILLAAGLRLSSALSQLYNPERGALHTGFIFAILLLPLLMKFKPVFAAFLITVLILSSFGLSSLLFGGGMPGRFNNNGEDFERFIISAKERDAINFLVENSKPGQLVFTDRYGAVSLQSNKDIDKLGVISFILPDLIDKRGFIYLSRTNTINGRSRGYSKNKLTVYSTPLYYYDAKFNLLYNNGEVMIYG